MITITYNEIEKAARGKIPTDPTECRHCHTVNQAGSRYCCHCGFKLVTPKISMAYFYGRSHGGHGIRPIVFMLTGNPQTYLIFEDRTGVHIRVRKTSYKRVDDWVPVGAPEKGT